MKLLDLVNEVFMPIVDLPADSRRRVLELALKLNAELDEEVTAAAPEPAKPKKKRGTKPDPTEASTSILEAVDAVKKRGEASPTEVAKDLRLAVPAANSRLRKALKAGLLKSEKRGRYIPA